MSATQLPDVQTISSGRLLNEGNAGEVESPEILEGDLEEIDEPYPNSEPVTYAGADFDVEGLVRRLTRKDIAIPTFGHGDRTIETAGFQRDFVWRKPQMDKFIESLLFGYPVPGIFLVEQRDRRYLVLDGQQRLRTLAHFYEGTFGSRVFDLKYVCDKLKGKTFKTLTDEQRRTLGNTFIQAIVVKTDGSPASLESVYQIFERLNSGGTQLTGHEIRVALYAGQLIDYVAQLADTTEWRALYGTRSPRLRDQELVLRVIALYVSPGTYKRPLKQYLNTFVGENRDCSKLSTDSLSRVFKAACTALGRLGPTVFRYQSNQVNAALAEAMVVATMRAVDAGTTPTEDKLQTAYQALLTDEVFRQAVSRATADEESVRTRMNRAARAVMS
jgi:hypothetical protein